MGDVAKAFSAGDTVNIDSLLKGKVLRNVSKGGVKILSGGKIDKALNFSGVAVSAGVKAEIEKAGGSVK